MTQTINTPAFSAKAAAAAWVSATNAAAKKTIRTRVAETAQKSPRKRWAALLKDIDTGDVARVKARATGDWKAINDAREKAPAKPKAAPKAKPAPKVAPKAAAPAKREAPKANISAVDAAKALAALIEAGMAGSPEAQTILAFIRKA